MSTNGLCRAVYINNKKKNCNILYYTVWVVFHMYNYNIIYILLAFRNHLNIWFDKARTLEKCVKNNIVFF